VLNELCKQILSGKVHKDSVIFITIKNENEFVFENLEEVEVVK
jgi:ATP-dependent Clp protease ATP-binding subunit ClpB